MIHVLAFITAKPQQRDIVLKIFTDNLPAVHAEDGCIEYGATIDVTGATPAFGPDTFVVVEKWRDKAALAAHGASPHMKAFAVKIKDHVADLQVHVLQPA
ncbi:MAG TPA: putative quinol monooxygenase [Terriglobales bacterium]|nr:putative quinol monooxygenase [Terriglobales bacterium]